MLTLGSICGGGMLLNVGAEATEKVFSKWSVEFNPDVAELAQLNFPNTKIVVDDACNVNWLDLPATDILWASPSCRNFSNAGDRTEKQADIDLGKAIGRAIATHRPRVFALENATAYKDSQSWKEIIAVLDEFGYSTQEYVFNFNEWGIPQKKRIRMIVVAFRDGSAPLITVPNRTKRWYQEIEDLIPTFKRSPGLTGTQIKNLHPKTKAAINRNEIILLKRTQISYPTSCAYQSEDCCWTVTAQMVTDHKKSSRKLFADLVMPDGNILSLNTRALARIQTVPDSYQLTDKISVDGLAIGDGVPCFFAEQLFHQIIDSLQYQYKLRTTLENKLFPKKVQQRESDKHKNDHNCGRFEKLDKLVSQYAGNEAGFIELAIALQEIKLKKLYKSAGYRGFRNYCRERHNLGRTYVDNLIRAIPIYKSISSEIDKSLITEFHCRELAKIEDPQKRSQVLSKVAQGKITAKAIKQEYRDMVVKAINTKTPPKLPAKNSIIKLTTKNNPDLKRLDGRWGIVSKVNELTCEGRVLGNDHVLLNSQDFMVVEEEDQLFIGFAIGYLSRLNKLYSHPKINRLGKLTIENLACDTPEYPDELTEDILTAMEKNLFTAKLELEPSCDRSKNSDVGQVFSLDPNKTVPIDEILRSELKPAQNI